MKHGRDLLCIEPFDSSPFPLRQGRGAGGKPFFDQRDGARRGRTTRHGEVFWEDEAYSDARVLLGIPGNFDAQRPATLVVFMHGNRAQLERDVLRRQHLARQVREADINAVLVAPQFALDAPDSSAGRFALRGVFRDFLKEAAHKLGELYHAHHDATAHAPRKRLLFQQARVIIIAYSGGYCPAAAALTVGGALSRVRGLVLLDALYDHERLFADWLQQHRRHAFLVSAYTHSTRTRNVHLRTLLKEREHAYTLGLTSRLAPGSVCLVPLDGSVEHADVITRAWCEDPVTDVLRRAGAELGPVNTSQAT